MSSALQSGREICGDLESALRREWLVTNGIGGYAAGSLAGIQTRRYHGLLVAALDPPVGRTLLLADLDVTARVDGRMHELGTHEYTDGTVHPSGYRALESFRLDGTVPTWTYALGPALLVRRVYMARGMNTAYVSYTHERGDFPLALTARPLATGRDYHGERRGDAGYAVEVVANGCEISVAGIGAVLSITADAGEFRPGPLTYWNVHHREEAARGLNADEDLYSPGSFIVDLAPGETVAFTASCEAQAPSAAEALRVLRAHETALLALVPSAQPAWIRRLQLAADQFIVSRRSTRAALAASAHAGCTVIAGYPWFSDWGRDTMIALPGLALATGRPEIAAGLLRTYAEHLRDGLLPNRFPDAGEAPEYNTVDATLWYVVAVHEYLAATGDLALVRELYPALHGILESHRRGTRHGIAVDPTDGLLRAGEAGVQLTWMDAKVGSWVVTPRTGKPVEINALWCNALAILGGFALKLRERAAATELSAAAAAATAAFAERFWYADGGYLYDVIDGPDGAGPDRTLRPNQLLALALPHAVLDARRAASALSVCERELLTSYGLRTLGPGEPGYAPRYQGDPRARDAAYHQGTVWPWLLGSFARAHYALHGDRGRALSYLAPLEHHLHDACIGQISEIFDAEAPHAARGCIAQAWSVAEVLRSWLAISAEAPIRSAAKARPKRPPSPRPSRSRP